MQCYIILYSNDGSFLTFTKRTESYFLNGSLYFKGKPIENGAGLFAFPGGALNAGEEPYQGCLREFTEECGTAIGFDFQVDQSESLMSLRDVRMDNNITFNILNSSINTVGVNYHTLYLELGTVSLNQIEDIILNTNFDQANEVRQDIRSNEIRNYDAIFEGYPFCPQDDELGDVDLWQIEQQIDEIRALNQNQATDWYFDMIDYLANTILEANINY